MSIQFQDEKRVRVRDRVRVRALYKRGLKENNSRCLSIGVLPVPVAVCLTVPWLFHYQQFHSKMAAS